MRTFCIVFIACCVAVQGQTTNTGYSSSTYNTVYIDGTYVTVGLNGAQAIADACAGVAASVTGHATYLQQTIAQLNAVAGQNVAASIAVKDALESINLDLTGLKNALNASTAAASASSLALTAASTAITTAVTPLPAQMAALTTAVGGLNAAVTTAIGNSAAQFGTVAVNNLNPRLDAIKDVLLTNGFGSNTVNITTTNGTSVSVTNNINVNVPSLVNLEQYALDAQAGKEPASAAANNAPTNYSALLDTATALSPFGSLGLLAAPAIDLGTLPANFMQISIPKPAGGGSWVFDFNPTTHFGGPISAFRVAAAWVLLLLFLVQCGRIAQEATQTMASAQQTHSPNVAVLGNNAGLVIGLGYVSVFIVAAGAFALVMASVIDKTLFGQLANNPVSSFGTDALLLANLFFPLGQIFSQAVWLLTARWLVVAQSWIFATIIRLMPA